MQQESEINLFEVISLVRNEYLDDVLVILKGSSSNQPDLIRLFTTRNLYYYNLQIHMYHPHFQQFLRRILVTISLIFKQIQKQPFRGVLSKRCSENMQQIYRRTPIPKCNYNKNHFLLRTPLNGCFCKDFFQGSCLTDSCSFHFSVTFQFSQSTSSS